MKLIELLVKERQNASIQQIVELRRDVDEMAKDVDKLKGKVWWLGGVAAACTFILPPALRPGFYLRRWRRKFE
jgi:hypothetical protein